MTIIHDFTLDVSRQGVQCTVPLTQHDVGVHRLIIRLCNGGNPLPLNERNGAVLYSEGDRYEGCTVYTAQGAHANCIVCDLGAEATAKAGTFKAVLRIYEGGDKLLYSPQLAFSVRDDITSGSLVLSSPQYAAVVKAQCAAEQYASAAQNASDSAEAAKESAAGSEKNAREAQTVALEAKSIINDFMKNNGEAIDYLTDFATSSAPKIEGRLSAAEEALGGTGGAAGTAEYPELKTENTAVIPAVNELSEKLSAVMEELEGKADAANSRTHGAFEHTGDICATETISARMLNAFQFNGALVTVATTETNTLSADKVTAKELNVTGSAVVKNWEQAELTDGIIVVNSNGGSVSGTYCGLVIRTSAEEAYAILFDADTHSVKLGYGTYSADNRTFAFAPSDGSAILTREEAQLIGDGALVRWDSAHSRVCASALGEPLAAELSAALADRALPEYDGHYICVENGKLRLIEPESIKSIASVEQTTESEADGGTNVYTVTLNDGSRSTLKVRNGRRGSKGDKGDKGEQGEKGDRGDKGEQGDVGIAYVHGKLAGALKGKVCGECVSMNDVSELEHTLTVKLKRKNYLTYPFGAGTVTQYGVSYTDMGDGTVSVSGTAAENNAYDFVSSEAPLTLTAGTYKMRLEGGVSVTGAPLEYIVLDTSSNTRIRDTRISAEGVYAGDATFQLSGDTSVRVYLIAHGGAEITGSVRPVLETAEADGAGTLSVRRCGENVYPHPPYDESKVMRGISFTYNENGSLHVQGTAESPAYFFMLKDQTLPAGKYTLSGSAEGVLINMQRNGVHIGYSSKGSIYTFEANEGDLFTSAVYVDTGTTVNATLYPLLEVGDATQAETFVPEADGTVEGINSVSPRLTLITNRTGVEIECEYNRSLGIVLEEIEQRIVALEEARGGESE